MLAKKHFSVALKMLVTMMIDGDNAASHRLHFICCQLKRTGRAMERKKDAWVVLRRLLL